ncbi:hypothetical protein LJB86_02420 [Deltaproteobacteria bacterium OttesenSCG-928-M10]|nr:hypothetical protein [Deltaproteobacteria bacterium OttesenSCG-928-M10]
MQINDDLVKYITRELMKRLGAGASIPGAAPDKPLLCITGGLDKLSTPALMEIQKSFEICEFRNWDDPWPGKASVLITSLGLQALVRVAEGDEGCTVEGRALLKALLNGQPVAALAEGLAWRSYQSTAPKGLLNRYRHYETVLQGYGLKLVDENGVTAALAGRSAAPLSSASVLPGPAQGPAPAFAKPAGGRQVWSEADVMSACPVARGEGQTLRLGAGDFLTPLAQDYAKTMKINIIKG